MTGLGYNPHTFSIIHNQPKAPTEDEGQEEMFMKHLFTMLLALIAATASAQAFEKGGIYYRVLSEDDRTVEVISGADEYKGDIVIPEEVIYDSKVYLVTTIGDYAFYLCDALTSVSMPSVTTIGDGAFNYCEALTSVHIPASCTSIAGNPFPGCESLEEIVVDENNPNYSSMDGVLYDKYMSTLIACPGKKSSIDMSSSVTTIGDNAFNRCWNLTSVSMPSVTTIGDWAFSFCSALTSVSMPSVTTIGDNAFYWCESLTSVSMPSVTTIGGGAFCDCVALTSVSIPSVTTIGNWAFRYCSALTSVHIPASCTSIVGNPFQQCKSLEEIVVDENNPNYSSMDGVLYDKYMSTLIACPGKKSSIDMSSSVTTIGDGAFMYCNALTSVSMPSVTTIGGSAFYSCDGLTSVSMPSVTTIGDKAFRYCSSLTSIDIPASCTSIVGNTFKDCKSLEEIVVDENNPNYSSADGVLYDKDKTTLIGWPTAEGEIDIIPSVTTIGEYAFSDCSALTSVSMPAVTTIGYGAFGSCEALTSVSMPSATTIGEYAFGNCSALTSVEMPEATTIGDNAFSSCDGLTSVSMPSVTTIGDEAFRYCSSLTSIDIPASVTTLGNSAFGDCNGLTSVYCHWVEPLECNPWFTDEVLENAILFVPRETVDAYRSVKPWSDFANIVEARYSGIADTPGSGLSVTVIDGAITVEGGDSTASAPVVEVYSAGGLCIYRGTDSSIGGLSHGIYVVKVGGTVQKVAL